MRVQKAHALSGSSLSHVTGKQETEFSGTESIVDQDSGSHDGGAGAKELKSETSKTSGCAS